MLVPIVTCATRASWPGVVVHLGKEGLFLKWNMVLLRETPQKGEHACCSGFFVYTVYTVCRSLLFVC